MQKNTPFESAMLELTNRCNMNCDFCINSQMTRKRENMDFGLFKRMVDEITKNDLVDFVTFHNMGEPLLYPRLVDAAKYALARGLKLGLCTNGLLLGSFFAEEIKKLNSPKLNLIISFQSVGPANFDRRHAPIDYDEYYKRILDFIREIGFGCTSTISLRFWMFENKNLKASAAYHDFLLLLRRICADLRIPVAARDDFFSRLDSTGEINVLKAIRIYRNLYLDLHCWYTWPGLSSKRSETGYCKRALIQSFGILPNGDVTLCCVDYDGRTSIGNVMDRQLMDVLLSGRAKEVIRSFKAGKPDIDFCMKCISQSPRDATSREEYEAMLGEIRSGERNSLYREILLK